MKLKQQKRESGAGIFVHLFFIFFCFLCFMPLVLVISGSLTEEKSLVQLGYSVIPRVFDTSAYTFLFANPTQIIDAYKVTIFITIVGTIASVTVMTLMAYPLSRSNFKFKTAFTAFIFFPTLFSGGLVPSYIINTQYLKLSDTMAILILPSLVSVFYIIMLRTFFKQLPDGLFEAAKLDGASEFKILTSIAVPLSTPVLATIAFLGSLGRWNEWYRCMLYIRSDNKLTLQYLLQRMMSDLSAIQQAMEYIPLGIVSSDLPSENLRMAMVVVAIGPMLLAFPFFQKYFTRGMTVGAVKG